MQKRTRQRTLTYRDAGVDIELKQGLIPQLKRLAQSTVGPEVIAGIGGFAALIDAKRLQRMSSPVLVAGTDGVGTKLKIAFATGRHDTVGIDCVAMCANDIICSRATPLFFLDYIAAGRLDEKVALALVKGLAQGCREAGMSLVGGETAQMPGMYRDGEYDLAGFAVGIAERREIPSPKRLRAGHVLVGLGSTGLHSNGFSLARKVLLEKMKLRLDTQCADLGCALGEELLRPTRIYVRLGLELFRRFDALALANITGGGMVENLPRVLPSGLRAVIRRGSWPVPPIFDLIAQGGKITREEMDRTFNNGIGMIAVIRPEKADRAVRFLTRRRCPAYVIGELEKGPTGVQFV